ncbi:Pc21g22450 [Penicillium rubens Wisconsin 54-1255]|uniref:Pc21g22450 protein n=1 Tax=Penicillium rubens (strain ATCC 28089 / DSM 1075 / NRRL 1951 / Wisconsin 54-1255) TaxID=500485 RepID=B6HNF3_PENRW|nr:Pc21g22450 [Penicillium rubens Wisconsin 54-1255]
MSAYSFDKEQLRNLRGRTILITGAASGIGRAAAQIAHGHGANLVLGDLDVDEGNKLVNELQGPVLFRKTDISKWNDVLSLFEAGVKEFGIIHSVLANAGMNKEDLLAEDLDGNGRLLPPNLGSISVNLVGAVYTVKSAVHFFSKWPETKCQIVLTASAASYLETPPLYLYSAAKTGVLGLMRGLRSQLVRQNITINVVAPWMTITNMVPPSVLKLWGNLPANQPWGVAHALLLPLLQPEINGKAFFVAGHRIIDLEDKLMEIQPLWMGEQLSSDIAEGQRRLTT